jgi:mycothiol synthase
MEPTFRPARPEDLEGLLALQIASQVEIGRPVTATRHAVEREWFKGHRFDPTTMSQVAILGDELIGQVAFEVHHDQLHSEGYVAPMYRGRGIGSWFLRWVVEQARADDAAATAWTWAPAERKDGIELIERTGFTHVRSFVSMRHPDPAAIAEPVWPGRIELRTFTGREACERAAEAWNLSFIDHWNFHADTADDYLERIEDPEEDPSLWTFAYDGDTLAGFCLTSVRTSDNVARGQLGPIGTSRSHRGIGLGRALLRHGVRALAARGVVEVRLGVDTQNPSGAVRLYEANGFEQTQEGRVYRIDV